MRLFESPEDKKLRAKIAAEERAKFDVEQTALKAERIRKEEAAKLRNGGVVGAVLKETKKFLQGD